MRSGYFVERPRRGLLQSERVFSSRASLFVSPCGVVLMSCKVNFDVIRSALQNSMCLLRGCLHDTGATFAPERLHSASLSWLYICLHDTATKCHAGVSSPRFLLTKSIVLLKFSLPSCRWIFVVITWTRMLDGKANGCSQWFLSHRSVASGLEKPLLAG